MTFQFRALSDIEADIKYRFSIGGVRSRHPSDRIRQLFNVSWQQLRTIVSLAHDGTFLEATSPASLPTTAAVSGESYAELSWPVNAVSIYGIRVQRDTSSRWYPLKRVPWSAHHDYQCSHWFDSWERQTGPIAYCSRTIPKATESAETAGAIMVFPVPRGGLYRLWYMEAWQPQVEDNDLFPGHEEWIEWAIYNTLIKMLGPDADSRKSFAMWDLERRECRQLIEARALRLEDGASLEPRDARGDGYEHERWSDPL